MPTSHPGSDRDLRARAGRALPTLGFILVAVLVAGCAADPKPILEARPLKTPSPTAHVKPHASTASKATGTAPQHSAHPLDPGSTTTTSSTSLPCTSSRLGRVGQTVRNLGKGTDGQFHYADDVVVSNVSDASCFVSGWVGLAMYGDDTAVYCPRADGTDPCHGRPKSKDAQVEQRVTETGSEHQIALEPGHRVTFSVEYEG